MMKKRLITLIIIVLFVMFFFFVPTTSEAYEEKELSFITENITVNVTSYQEIPYNDTEIYITEEAIVKQEVYETTEKVVDKIPYTTYDTFIVTETVTSTNCDYDSNCQCIEYGTSFGFLRGSCEKCDCQREITETNINYKYEEKLVPVLKYRNITEKQNITKERTVIKYKNITVITQETQQITTTKEVPINKTREVNWIFKYPTTWTFKFN